MKCLIHYQCDMFQVLLSNVIYGNDSKVGDRELYRTFGNKFGDQAMNQAELVDPKQFVESWGDLISQKLIDAVVSNSSKVSEIFLEVRCN